MEAVLADTSVWIDFFNGKKSSECDILFKYLENDGPVLICPPIIQEILQGIRNDSEYQKVKTSILSLDVLSIEPIEAAIGTADLYRLLRKHGATIKRSMDCLIAYYAIYYNVNLLHKDKDFDIIAKNSSLKIRKV